MPQNFDRTQPADAVKFFRHCILTGNLEGALSCFDEEAIYIERDGEEIKGLENIRKPLEHLCGWKPNIQGIKHKATIVGDLAVWADKWILKAHAPDGSPIEMNGATTCMMKKNEAGIWLWLVDNPFAGQLFED